MATKKSAKRPKAAPKRPTRPKRKQPETLRVRSASPSFTVNDLPKSIAWYRDVLGFTEGERWDRDGKLEGIEMVAGTITLMLGQDDFAKGRDRRKGEGTRVWLNTAQSIDALAKRIKEHGGRLDYEPRDQPWGDRTFGLTDPDGFHLTFVQL